MKIGILGGGQLGRMLALAGYPLGLEFRFWEPGPAEPVRDLAEVVSASYDDPVGLDRFLDGLDLVTYEFENVPFELAERLAERTRVCPPPAALAAAQERLAEKSLFRELGIPTTEFAPVEVGSEALAVAGEVGTPAILKSRRFGYDGNGQVSVDRPEDCEAAWSSIGGVPALLERRAPFQRELSIIGVRGRWGDVAFYPLVENHHREGILRYSRVPAPGADESLRSLAEDYARRVLERLDYVGVLTIEFFQMGDRLLANEMAPRVHNSGHWTIEGSPASQFENHLRAIAGWPLGRTEATGTWAMLNVVGSIPGIAAMLEASGSHLHLYGKEPRPRRKLGHVTLGRYDDDFDARLAYLRGLVGG